jgi:hypothetical protein
LTLNQTKRLRLTRGRIETRNFAAEGWKAAAEALSSAATTVARDLRRLRNAS